MLNLALRRPSMELASSFENMRDAFMAAGEDAWAPETNASSTVIAHTDVAAYVELLCAWSRAEQLPKGWSRTDALWIVDEDTVLGELDVRYALSSSLRQIGGHIGYNVHPGYRNRGVATFAVCEALRLLQEAGVHEAMVTCLDTNTRSARVIEKCGGRRVGDSNAPGPKRRRYVIDLGEG